MGAKFNGLFEKLKIKQKDNDIVPSGELAQPSTLPKNVEKALNKLQPQKSYDQCGHSKQQLNAEEPCLAQTLKEVIHDPTALSYLINFLEEIGHLKLLKFWLHVDGLKASCVSDIEQINGCPKNNLPHSAPFSTSLSKSEALRCDANKIFSTYIDVKAPQSIELPVHLQCSIEKFIKLLNSCETSEKLIGECLDEAQEYVWRVLANRYFKEFYHSHFYAKYTLEVMQSGKLSLEDILRSHKLLCSFIEFLENEHQRQLLEFVIAVDSFVFELDQMSEYNESALHSDGSPYPVNEVQQDAMLIYDRYFSMQATDPLGFGDQIRVELESNICTIDGMPKNNAFEKSRHIAATLLQNKFIPLFIESHHFAKILCALQSTIENIPDRLHCSQRPSTSQHPSSNVCVSSAVDENSTTRQARFRNCSYDYDEDELEYGKETQCSSAIAQTVLSPQTGRSAQKARYRIKLNSLAKVDKLGRYKPLFDNSLCSSSNTNDSIYSAKGRLKNALDKYLNQTAAKENLAAEEAAELIIEDIQKKTATINAARRQSQVHMKGS